MLHAKNNGGGAGKPTSPLADALGIPLARARLQLLLEQRAARKSQTAAADAATAHARAALASDEPPATEAGSEATVAAMAAATIQPGPARERGERRAIFWARVALAASPILGIPRALGIAARSLLPSWLTRSGRDINGWGADAFERLAADTFVCDVGPHAKHALVLNRFPVIPRHCVIVTRRFEPQEAPLTTDDLAALWSWCVTRLSSSNLLRFFSVSLRASIQRVCCYGTQCVPPPLHPSAPLQRPSPAWLRLLQCR